MVLVDTSVWVDHLRHNEPRLAALLENSKVLCHPLVIDELACGNLKNRDEILTALMALPTAPSMNEDEYLMFVDQNGLYGVGIGFVDVHLLASALLADAPLWTVDKRLNKAAADVGISYL